MPSMTSSPSSTRTPPSTSGSIDLLDGDLAADLLTQRRPQPLPLLRGQRPGHPDGGHHPVLLRRGQGDEALDGVGEGPLARRHRPLGQTHRRVGGPPVEQLADQLLRGCASADRRDRPARCAARGRTRPAGRTGRARPRSPPACRRARPRISWARTACRSRAAAKVRPPAQRMAAASATMSTAVVGDLAVEQSVDQPRPLLRGDPGRSRPDAAPAEDSSASTTANRSADSAAGRTRWARRGPRRRSGRQAAVGRAARSYRVEDVVQRAAAGHRIQRS